MKGKAFDSDKVRDLIRAILAIEDRDQCYRFLRDLTSSTEISAFADRLRVATMLYHGQSYREITKKTGVSSATIAKIAKSMNDGSGGLLAIVKKINDIPADLYSKQTDKKAINPDHNKLNGNHQYRGWRQAFLTVVDSND